MRIAPSFAFIILLFVCARVFALPAIGCGVAAEGGVVEIEWTASMGEDLRVEKAETESPIPLPAPVFDLPFRSLPGIRPNLAGSSFLLDRSVDRPPESA